MEYPGAPATSLMGSDHYISGWRRVCYKASEGPKGEAMESVGEPQCYSLLHQERELGSSISPLLPSVTHLQSHSYLDSQPREGSLGTKTTEGEDDVRTLQSTATDRTHSQAVATLRRSSNKSVLRSFPCLTGTFLGAKMQAVVENRSQDLNLETPKVTGLK